MPHLLLVFRQMAVSHRSHAILTFSVTKLMPALFIGSTGIHRGEECTRRSYCEVAGFSQDVGPCVPQENV